MVHGALMAEVAVLAVVMIGVLAVIPLPLATGDSPNEMFLDTSYQFGSSETMSEMRLWGNDALGCESRGSRVDDFDFF